MVDFAPAKDREALVDKIAEAKQQRPKKRPKDAARQPFFFELSRLMVVAITGSSYQLQYIAQTKPNGPWETNWTPIDTTQTYEGMTAGLTADGRVAVVAQSSDATALFYIDEVADSIGSEGWNAPVSLGKPSGVNEFLNLAMTLDADARLEIFGTDDAMRIWWKYQNPNRVVQTTVTTTPPGTGTPITVTVDEIAPPLTPWSDWIQLPGGLGPIYAQHNADGRIVLFGLVGQGELYRSEQTVAQALQPSDWSEWVRMDTGSTGGFVVLAPVLDASGAVNLFGLSNGASGDGSQVYQARQAPACTSTWTGWTTPGYIRGGVQSLAAGPDGNNHLVLTATDNSFLYNVNLQSIVEAQQWTGWNPFSVTACPNELALDYNSDGRLTLFSLGQPAGEPGGLWCASQMVLDSTEWESDWTTLAQGDIRQFAVVRDLTPPASAFK